MYFAQSTGGGNTYIRVVCTYLLVMVSHKVEGDSTAQTYKNMLQIPFLSCFPFSLQHNNAMFVLSTPDQCKSYK